MKTSRELRVINARALQAECGGQSEFMRITGKAQAQVSKTIGENVKDLKPIGDSLARHIESCFSKPRGWLDNDHTHDDLIELASNLKGDIKDIFNHILRNEQARAILLAHLESSSEEAQ